MREESKLRWNTQTVLYDREKCNMNGYEGKIILSKRKQIMWHRVEFHDLYTLPVETKKMLRT